MASFYRIPGPVMPLPMSMGSGMQPITWSPIHHHHHSEPGPMPSLNYSSIAQSSEGRQQHQFSGQHQSLILGYPPSTLPAHALHYHQANTPNQFSATSIVANPSDTVKLGYSPNHGRNATFPPKLRLAPHLMTTPRGKLPMYTPTSVNRYRQDTESPTSISSGRQQSHFTAATTPTRIFTQHQPQCAKSLDPINRTTNTSSDRSRQHSTAQSESPGHWKRRSSFASNTSIRLAQRSISSQPGQSSQFGGNMLNNTSSGRATKKKKNKSKSTYKHQSIVETNSPESILGKSIGKTATINAESASNTQRNSALQECSTPAGRDFANKVLNTPSTPVKPLSQTHVAVVQKSNESPTAPHNSTVETDQSCIEQPQPLGYAYEPCMNPACNNTFPYLRPHLIVVPSEIGETTLKDSSLPEESTSPKFQSTVRYDYVQELLLPPAWCAMSPCGCKLCRSCFSSILTNCLDAPASLENETTEKSTTESDGPTNTRKEKHRCVCCSARVAEFSPVNTDLQAMQIAEDMAQVSPSVDLLMSEDANSPASTRFYCNTDNQASLLDMTPDSSAAHTSISHGLQGFQSAQDRSASRTFEVYPATPREPSLLSAQREKYPYAQSDPPASIRHSPLMATQSYNASIHIEPNSRNDHSTKRDLLPCPVMDLESDTSNMSLKVGDEIKDPNAVNETSLIFPTLRNPKAPIVSLPPRRDSIASVAKEEESSPILEIPDLAAWSTTSASTAPSSPEVPFTPTLSKTILSDISSVKAESALLLAGDIATVQLSCEPGHSPSTRRRRAAAKQMKTADVNTKKVESGQGTDLSALPSISSVRVIGAALQQEQSNSIVVQNAQKASALVVNLPTPARTERKVGKSSAPAIAKESGSYPPAQAYDTSMGVTSSTNRVIHQHESTSPTSAGARSQMSRHEASGRKSFNGSPSQKYNSAYRRDQSSPARPSSRSTLPNDIASPSPETLLAWQESKSMWGKDPWTGRLMQVDLKDLPTGGSIRVRSDGRVLADGLAAGISWPILKIHNIAFKTTIADIEAFVTGRAGPLLAPLDLNAQGVHLLNDIATGKTLPYAYIECISVQAAERLMRETEGKLLLGRQVALKPASQKDLALDLFPHLRRANIPQNSLLVDDPALASLRNKGKVAHNRHSSFPSMASLERLNIFSDADEHQLRQLIDISLGGKSEELGGLYSYPRFQQSRDTDLSFCFDFPAERPLARLASMIAKYPCHIVPDIGPHAVKRRQELERLFASLVYALENLLPALRFMPELHSIAAALCRSGVQCPSFNHVQKDRIRILWSML